MTATAAASDDNWAWALDAGNLLAQSAKQPFYSVGQVLIYSVQIILES